jgi:hypothetical protein
MADIVTGFELGVGQPGHVVAPRGSEFQRAVLFSPESRPDQKFSRRVEILPGMAALFTCHNLPPNRVVYTNQVVVGLASGQGTDFYRIRMKIIDPEKWVFTRDAPQKIVSLPGVYRFELDAVDVLGEDFLMEYMTWRLADRPVDELVVL